MSSVSLLRMYSPFYFCSRSTFAVCLCWQSDSFMGCKHASFLPAQFSYFMGYHDITDSRGVYQGAVTINLMKVILSYIVKILYTFKQEEGYHSS